MDVFQNRISCSFSDTESGESTPLILVWAVKGINLIADLSPVIVVRRPNFSFARTTMLRPSGVSSASEDNCASSANSRAVIFPIGMKSTACRFPRVIVPVLSRSKTSTSPAASTAFPERAITFRRIRRSIPAMPIAGSNPPIVVGIRQTNNASKYRYCHRSSRAAWSAH